MHTGTIKRLARDRGFGFISDTDGRDIFFHQSNLVDVKFSELNADQKVEFDVDKTEKGPCAVNIHVIKETA